ncbi:MAG: hypothetical protein KDF60_08210 [Calditrichaeota bacterium]|nr:hypothetical protein [Calditrichota bacterium]
MSQKYAVIIADIQGSKKMSERARYEWQLFLKSAIVQVNENWSNAIEASFMITKGDEFQGVLHDIPIAHDIMIEFERLLRPLQLRFGIGLGRIQKMGANIPIEMDGPAFHRANMALMDAKKCKHHVHFRSGDEQLNLYINSMYSLIYAIKKGWSDINISRYWKYKELGTYEKVADIEGVSPQAVWDSLRNANAIEVIEAEETVREFLQAKMNEFNIEHLTE